jgi:hypothetical protein
MKVYGIADISTSEGKLQRFTKICCLIKPSKTITKSRIVSSVKTSLGLSNYKEIERHLTILQKIGLIQKIDDVYILSSLGKALCELSKGSEIELSEKERIFYFTTLFTSVLKQQLLLFMETVFKNESKPRKEIIMNYFSTKFAQSLWNKETVKKNLIRLKETNKIPSFMENKFGCMEMWLKDLKLVEKKKGKTFLTEKAKVMMRDIEGLKLEDIENKIYELAGIVFLDKVIPFSYSKHNQEFLKLLYDSYSLFRIEQGLGDFKAIMKFISVNLLEKGIKIEEREFNENIKLLWSEGIVKSILLGRNGKPAHIVLTLHKR